MEIKDDDLSEGKMEPDYEYECENCGSTPTVIVIKDNMVVHHTGLCGPCCFGSADCIDPDNW